MTPQKPLVSVIITNFNGVRWLKGSLDSLKKQTLKSFEVIFVDNGSTDNSVDFVKKNYPKVKIVQSDKNLGFAGGNNFGYQKAKGKYILLINNDTRVEKDFLKKFVRGFDKFPNAGIVQSKIVWMDSPNKIDSCGSYWTDTGFMYYIGNSKNAKLAKYNKPFMVFSVKGASVMIKRELIEKIGFFDETYWSYYEETDLCHRAWIAGYESWYYPEPVCRHAIGGTSLTFKNDFIQFHNFKNKLSSFIKNLETANLIKIIPVFIILNVVISLMWILQGKYKHSMSLFKAILWNLKNLRSVLKKRSFIQKNRLKTDKDIFNLVRVNPKPIYYYHLFNNNLALYND